MSIDHIGIIVNSSHFDQVVTWYLSALSPLSFQIQKEFGNHTVGLGPSRQKIPFWISSRGSDIEQVAATHVAFSASNRETVDKFHEEALKAGGRDNGKPGWRHQYHAKYYAGFVLDPVGNNVEVVDHGGSRD